MFRHALTCGDINGIGPEIVIKSINSLYNSSIRNFAFFCPSNVFEKTIEIVKPNFPYEIIKKEIVLRKKKHVIIYDIGKFTQSLGKPTTFSGHASYESIINGYDYTYRSFADSIITAPISKSAFQLAGINYPGHTELFANLTGTKKYLMTFLSKNMIAGLVTIHISIKDVSKSLTINKLRNSITIMNRMLINDLGIKNPKIAVLGLNPHAGEDGKIGDEEKKIIKPVLRNINNINVFGPFVPDAFFGNKKHRNFDAFLGMYHDQVLIPFKLINFEKGVNYTAGLPIIRTSPDHGTGYDIAGKGIADPSSFIEAIKWAEKIIKNRNRL